MKATNDKPRDPIDVFMLWATITGATIALACLSILAPLLYCWVIGISAAPCSCKQTTSADGHPGRSKPPVELRERLDMKRLRAGDWDGDAQNGKSVA